MSDQPPSPYGVPQQPYGAPPPYAGPPRRQRPRTLWFFVGGALLVLAPIVFVGSLFTVLKPLLDEDAVFAAADSPVQVDLPAGEERTLFTDPFDAADCIATDGSGADVEFRPVAGEFTVNEWQAIARFDTGDGDLTFVCSGESDSSEVRIGDLPSTGGFVAGIAIGIVVPLLLGLIGLVMLIVVTVLYATGAPRDKQRS